jgi:hypothetical protein
MHLGCGFASTVFRPIHAVGDKLHNRRIHRVNFQLEPPQPSLAFNASFNGMSIDYSTRNEIENLLEDGYVGAGWCFVVDLPLPSGRFL